MGGAVHRRRRDPLSRPPLPVSIARLPPSAESAVPADPHGLTASTSRSSVPVGVASRSCLASSALSGGGAVSDSDDGCVNAAGCEQAGEIARVAGGDLVAGWGELSEESIHNIVGVGGGKEFACSLASSTPTGLMSIIGRLERVGLAVRRCATPEPPADGGRPALRRAGWVQWPKHDRGPFPRTSH